MASKPRPSRSDAAPAGAPMTRVTHPLRRPVAGPRAGTAALAATTMARHLDVATSRRTDDEHRQDRPTPAALPWGVWPAASAQEDLTPRLGSALASYAAFLRQRRDAPAPPPPRGIPLIARRRGGTATGQHRGPGGLARSLVPVDVPVAAPEPGAERRAGGR